MAVKVDSQFTGFDADIGSAFAAEFSPDHVGIEGSSFYKRPASQFADISRKPASKMDDDYKKFADVAYKGGMSLG